MKVIIDRFEEDIAVIELDGKMYKADRALFAFAAEGDVIELTSLGKPAPGADDSPHSLFERLRRKSRRSPNAPQKEEK